MAGRDGAYVKSRMLDKAINREATILMKHRKIKKNVDNVIKLKKKGPVPGTQRKVYDYKWLPKQTHDYVDR